MRPIFAKNCPRNKSAWIFLTALLKYNGQNNLWQYINIQHTVSDINISFNTLVQS